MPDGLDSCTRGLAPVPLITLTGFGSTRSAPNNPDAAIKALLLLTLLLQQSKQYEPCNAFIMPV